MEKVSKETKALVSKTIRAKKKTEKAKADSVNVKPVISAIKAADKADGNVTERVRELYSGCKNASEFLARRAAIGKAISELVAEKETATTYKNRINAVLYKYILPEGMVLVNRGASKRKETIAKKKGKRTQQAANTKKVAQAATVLHDMASLLAAIDAVTEKASKSDCKAMCDRIVNKFANIIASKK